MNKSLTAFCVVAFIGFGCSGTPDSGAHTDNDAARTAAESSAAESTEEKHPSIDHASAQTPIPLGAQALIDSYPQFIKGYEDGKILFNDGTSMVYDDRKEKSFEYMLDNSDLEDMFYVRYTEPAGAPDYLADAGRSRNEALFKKMYGSSAAQVRRNLVNVSWFGQTVTFASANGAAEQLKKVATELSNHPELRKYLKSSGTFNWRAVRGAKRQSAHSYGIAFDIGVDHSDYWLWKNPGAKETSKLKYANRIPRKIVDIFRRYGFIWGGSWYHYDTMHFEYRPEILRYAELTATAQ